VKTVREIESLIAKRQELDRKNSSELLSMFACVDGIDFERNTEVMMHQLTDKYMKDLRELIDYEVGERLKTLNTEEI
jgi:hypothetical protein